MNVTTLLARIAAGRTDLVHDVLPALRQDPKLEEDGHTVLQWCAYYGDATALRLAMSAGAELSQLGDDLGINGAAFHGHWQLCQFLLEQGADANWIDPETGETPLHSAMTSEDRMRHDLVAAVLLARGADPNAETIPHKETGAFMRDCRTKGETPLHRAAAFGGVETIEALLARGADRTKLDVNGDSPLCWASWYRRSAEILRPLCYGPYRVRADYRGMRANLLGQPTDVAAGDG